MKALPPTIPFRWMSSELMSIGTVRSWPTAWALLGMFVSTVSNPKSLCRRRTSEACLIFWRSGIGPEPIGRSTMPNRAGSPAWGSRL
jgi:hypothetical protein